MRLRLIFALLLPFFVATACNLGGSPNPPEEDITDGDQQAVGQPQVSILSPTSGETVTVNEQVQVSVSATDAIGITRVQLFANGSLVKTVPSELADGEVSFEGILDFTPRTEGEYLLRVIAFRNAISSPPQEITINVSDEQITLTERPGTTTGSSTGSGNPNVNLPPAIPNDGLCRVLTLVGLNVRTQPTTTRNNVITTFPANTLLLVTARLGDNSWWKVTTGSTVGWVSGNPQFVSLSGNCGSIPIETVILNTPTPSPTPLPTNTPQPTNTPLPTNTPEPGVPDLVIPSIAIDDPVVIPTGETSVTIEITITVKNEGNGESGQFDVVLTIERDGFEDVLVDIGTVGNLDPDAILTLTQDLTFDAPDEYDLRIDVDPDDDVEESREFNNRADTTIEVVNES
ncbi:MAG: CARDB domain-containing protein [Anaerolineae bacterium]